MKTEKYLSESEVTVKIELVEDDTQFTLFSLRHLLSLIMGFTFVSIAIVLFYVATTRGKITADALYKFYFMQSPIFTVIALVASLLILTAVSHFYTRHIEWRYGKKKFIASVEGYNFPVSISEDLAKRIVTKQNDNLLKNKIQLKALLEDSFPEEN